MSKILLVDDNEINLMMTEMVLSEMHYEVETTTSGEAAIELLQKSPYDLMLLDIIMGGMSGIETLARIREMPGISDIRTIFLTTSSQIADMTEAIRLGAPEFIRKPTLPEKIYVAVRQALLMQGKDTILAVDDDEMSLLSIETMFGIRYNVRSVSSGAEALTELKREKPNLVLLDLYMPNMNGLEVLAQLRDIEGCEDLPVVFLTADTDVDTEAKLFSAGAADYIAKPIVLQVAMQRIRRILEFKHLQDSLHAEIMRQIPDEGKNNLMKGSKITDQ